MSGTLGEFLRSRRARLRPGDVGLPPGTGRRQTPGLRREELATLAGVSVDYYTRLEQGRDTRPGTAILDALATVLRLDDEERAHLYRLAAGPPRRPVPAKPVVRQGLRLLVESVRPSPAWVLDPAGTVLLTNPEGARLLPGIEDWPPQRRTITRYVFTHPRAREVFTSWDRVAAACVADLRAGPDQGLVEELSAASAEFATLWRRYDVRANRGGVRAFHDPAVGHFELTTEILTDVDGLRFVVFQAVPGTPDHEAVVLLALAMSARPDVV